MIVGLIALIGVSTVADIIQDRLASGKVDVIEANVAQARELQSALVETENAVRGYVLSGGSAEYLGPYNVASKLLERESAALPPGLALDAAQQIADNTRARVASDLTGLRADWTEAVRLIGAGQRPPAESALLSPHARESMDRLHDVIAGYLAEQSDAAEALARRVEVWSKVMPWLTLACVLVAIVAMLYAFGIIARAINTGLAAKQQTDELFAMADMLQSAVGQEDTNEVLRAAAAKLLPTFSGALYVFNNSRDRLDLSTHWGSLADNVSDHIAPNDCWALKRGKPHLNGPLHGALRCGHVHEGRVALEIPMAARGQLYGLLEIIAEGPDAPVRLEQVQSVVAAMGDAMSLALSSIALRERLRNQALRDSLTGLYNRRFLEEMLDRVCLDAERRKVPVSAIMIDLDHFKNINDKHGHGAGDAILRDVAAAIMSCLRATDVACRYGGEELAILLPDSSLASAAGKAEQIRIRISTIVLAGGISVTASLGVASLPETAGSATDLLANADAALYQAKQQGRDRVVTAAIRPSKQKLSLIEPTPA